MLFPGGGYSELEEKAASELARSLNREGITTFVLAYRLPLRGSQSSAPLADAARAIRTVRASATRWGVDAKRVGVLGFSAGGHLAAMLLTHFDQGNAAARDPVDRESSRPDFGILCYPIISMGAGTHLESRRELLGDSPTPASVLEASPDLHVTANTPPCFIWHTVSDQRVGVEHSLVFAAALRRTGVPHDLHVYEAGRHGENLLKRHPWRDDLRFWLREHGFL